MLASVEYLLNTGHACDHGIMSYSSSTGLAISHRTHAVRPPSLRPSVRVWSVSRCNRVDCCSARLLEQMGPECVCVRRHGPRTMASAQSSLEIMSTYTHRAVMAVQGVP